MNPTGGGEGGERESDRRESQLVHNCWWGMATPPKPYLDSLVACSEQSPQAAVLEAADKGCWAPQRDDVIESRLCLLLVLLIDNLDRLRVCVFVCVYVCL